LLRTLQKDGPAATHLAFSPDAKQLAIAERNGVVTFWHIPSGDRGAVWPYEPVKSFICCNGIRFSPDGRLLCISDYPRESRIVDVVSGKVIWKTPGTDGEVFTPDGKTLVLLSPTDDLEFIDTQTWTKRLTTRLKSSGVDHPFKTFQIAYAPDGQTMAVIFDGGSLILCDGRTGVEKHRLVDYAEMLRMLSRPGKRADLPAAIAFSPDGKWFASGGSAMVVTLWEVATGKEITTNKELMRFIGHDGEISALAFGPDGRTLFSFGQEGQGFLWKLGPAVGQARPLAELWDALERPDAEAAFIAQWQMVADAKASVPFLRERLHPVAAVDAGKIRQWIADVDSPRFAVRDAATKALEDAGTQVVAPIQKTLDGEVSLEARRRLEQIVKKHDTPLQLRIGRATQVLELIGSLEARAVLEALADGAPGGRETEAAKASLSRLGRRAEH
jgi:hypothetical protein